MAVLLAIWVTILGILSQHGLQVLNLKCSLEHAGAAAAALLAQGGATPAGDDSLVQMCASVRPHFQAGADFISLLACQSQVLQGRHIASLLLQRASPAAFLTSDQAMAALM